MSKFTDLDNFLAKGLLEMGAEKTKDKGLNGDIYVLKTIVGVLRVTIIKYTYPRSCRSKSAVLSVFSKFDDVELAKTKTDCSPYSGKWNFHVYAKDWTSGKDFAEYVLNRIKILKIPLINP